MCPHCKNTDKIVKNGFFKRESDGSKFQRFYCKNCLKTYSTQTISFDYRLRKRRINQSVFRLLSKGNSQHGSAVILSVHPQTIARRISRFGACAKKHLLNFQANLNTIDDLVFDEMETFEHTKLKPLTIPLAVENSSRKILALSVGKIAAKGHLAEISRKKYGLRKCERRIALQNLFSQLKTISHPCCIFRSDESKHYPAMFKYLDKNTIHKTYKGRKPSVTGQGEMKRGGFDPLFSLNHTAAMIRDNLKRMARRTWCTTKRIDRLLELLNIYAYFHNQRIDGIKRPSIQNCLINN
jgi:transposase-like protein